MNSVILPKGAYYIGDPCDVIDELDKAIDDKISKESK